MGGSYKLEVSKSEQGGRIVFIHIGGVVVKLSQFAFYIIDFFFNTLHFFSLLFCFFVDLFSMRFKKKRKKKASVSSQCLQKKL